MPLFRVRYVAETFLEVKMLKIIADSCRVQHPSVHGDDGASKSSACHPEPEMEPPKIVPAPHPWVPHFFPQR